MKLLKLSKELKHVLIIVLVLTIVFAFNDGASTFIFKTWGSNFIYVLILVLITVVVNLFGYKFAAKQYQSKAVYKLWDIEQLWFKKKWGIKKLWLKKTLPIKKTGNFYFGIILAIIITLMSAGTAFFTAISTFSITETKKLGRRFSKLEESEEGKIALIGLMANVILLMVFQVLSIDKGVSINSWFILWHILPISDLPGSKIFFSSKTLYIFVIVFFLLFLLLLSVVNLLFAIILAILFTIFIAIFYFIIWNLQGN